MAVKLHIDNWITKAEPDYYTMFIKAWIPLNAWYVDEYPQHKKRDTDIIKELKDSTNKIRNRIESLLTSTSPQSDRFCRNLAYLHNELLSRRLQHNNELLSFSSIFLGDISHAPANDSDKDGNNYQASKGTGFYRALIIKGKKTWLDIKMPVYDLEALITHEQYVGLSDSSMREKIRLCFEQINPKRPINLVSKSKKKEDKIVLDSHSKICFINNPELISKALIQVLYNLRCMLFHGEIDPSDINQGVYEHAFYILKSIIQELK